MYTFNYASKEILLQFSQFIIANIVIIHINIHPIPGLYFMHNTMAVGERIKN